MKEKWRELKSPIISLILWQFWQPQVAMKTTAVSKPEINWQLGSFSKPGPQFKFTENEHSTPVLDDDILKSRKLKRWKVLWNNSQRMYFLKSVTSMNWEVFKWKFYTYIYIFFFLNKKPDFQGSFCSHLQ